MNRKISLLLILKISLLTNHSLCKVNHCSISYTDKETKEEICSECQDSYYMKSPKVCVNCPQNCQKCSDDTKCSECSPGYFLSQETGTCMKCEQTCRTCVDISTCTNCADGHFPISSYPSPCSKCLENCKSCDSNSTCSACNKDYKLEKGDEKESDFCLAKKGSIPLYLLLPLCAVGFSIVIWIVVCTTKKENDSDQYLGENNEKARLEGNTTISCMSRGQTGKTSQDEGQSK